MKHLSVALSALLVCGPVWCLGAEDAPANLKSETAMRVSNNLASIYGTKDPLTRSKASAMHDRVTIVIDKEANARLQATTELDKESSITSAINTWFTLKVDEDGNLVANPRTGAKKPNVDVSLQREHQGEGETERTQSLQNRISGEVLEVMPNGQLVVVARTQITVNDERETVELTGRVDPKDMTPDSTVNADFVMDLSYRITGKGEVTDAAKRGWFAKVVDRLNPF